MVCASASMGATIAVNRIVFRATHGLLSPFQGFLVGCRLPVTRGLRRRALGCRPFRACGMLRPGTKRKEGRGMRAWGSGEAQSGYGTKPWCPRDRRPRRGTKRGVTSLGPHASRYGESSSDLEHRCTDLEHRYSEPVQRCSGPAHRCIEPEEHCAGPAQHCAGPE